MPTVPTKLPPPKDSSNGPHETDLGWVRMTPAPPRFRQESRKDGIGERRDLHDSFEENGSDLLRS